MMPNTTSRVLKATSLLLLMTLAVQSVTAQDSVYARRIIRQLTSTAMYGRGTSYRGDSIAAAFLADEMKRMGVRPLTPNYLQHYSYPCYSHEGPISLRVSGKVLQPYSQYRIYPTARYAKSDKLDKVRWKKQLKDGTWLFSVDKLDTYSPIVGYERTDPVCIEVLDSVLPKHPRRVELQVPLQYHNAYPTQNVVGYIPGEIDSMVIFTAHYDHCGTMGDGVIFPGAHDNASGVAAVMDIACHYSLSSPHYTLVFMLFSGEESGLLGSRHAAEHPLIDYAKVRVLCNIDMFCGGDEGLMVFNARSADTKGFFERMKQLNDQRPVAPELRPRDNAPNSDHYWFSSHCPSIFILTLGGAYGGYHDPADTCPSCSLRHYNDYLTLLLQAIGL